MADEPEHDAPEPTEPAPTPPPEPAPAAPVRAAEPPPSPQPAAAPPRPSDWRVPALIGGGLALIVLAIAAFFLFNRQPGELGETPLAPGEMVEEEEWPGLEGRLIVRPVSIGRPVLRDAMRATMLSGYADIEFTVGADGKASDIRVAQESAREIGYGAEGVRLVRGATWPTEWRGRTAPYEARYRVIFPPGRAGGAAIAPLAISSPTLTPEILALRRNAVVTMLVRVNEDGSVASADIVSADVQNAAVNAEAMRVALGARFPPNPGGFGYETELLVRFDVLSALGQEEAPAGPSVSLSEVPFAQRPSASDYDRHYPRRARRAGVEGRVELSCNVRRDRRLDCNLVSEDPPGQGFANAAMRIARSFRAEAQFPDGRSTAGAHVRVPLVFRLE